MQNSREDGAEHVVRIDGASEASKGGRPARAPRPELRSAGLFPVTRQRLGGGLQFGAVAGAGDDRRLALGESARSASSDNRSTSAGMPSPVLAESAMSLEV